MYCPEEVVLLFSATLTYVVSNTNSSLRRKDAGMHENIYMHVYVIVHRGRVLHTYCVCGHCTHYAFTTQLHT